MIIKTLFFLLLFIPLYIILSAILVAIIMASGGFDVLIEAEKAKQGVSQLISFTISYH